MYSSTADLMKLQESSRRKKYVVPVKSSLALSKIFYAGAYIQARTATDGNPCNGTVQVRYGWATVLYRLHRVFARNREKWCNIGRIMGITDSIKYNKFKLRSREM